MENGWPPIRLVVASMRTKEIFLRSLFCDELLEPADVEVALERIARLAVSRAPSQ